MRLYGLPPQLCRPQNHPSVLAYLFHSDAHECWCGRWLSRAAHSCLCAFCMAFAPVGACAIDRLLVYRRTRADKSIRAMAHPNSLAQLMRRESVRVTISRSISVRQMQCQMRWSIGFECAAVQSTMCWPAWGDNRDLLYCALSLGLCCWHFGAVDVLSRVNSLTFYILRLCCIVLLRTGVCNVPCFTFNRELKMSSATRLLTLVQLLIYLCCTSRLNPPVLKI